MASKKGNSSATADNSNELKLEIGLLSNVQTFSAVFKRIFLKFDRTFGKDEYGGALVDFEDDSFEQNIERLEDEPTINLSEENAITSSDDSDLEFESCNSLMSPPSNNTLVQQNVVNSVILSSPSQAVNEATSSKVLRKRSPVLKIHKVLTSARAVSESQPISSPCTCTSPQCLPPFYNPQLLPNCSSCDPISCQCQITTNIGAVCSAQNQTLCSYCQQTICSYTPTPLYTFPTYCGYECCQQPVSNIPHPLIDCEQSDWYRVHPCSCPECAATVYFPSPPEERREKRPLDGECGTDRYPKRHCT